MRAASRPSLNRPITAEIVRLILVEHVVGSPPRYRLPNASALAELARLCETLRDQRAQWRQLEIAIDRQCENLMMATLASLESEELLPMMPIVGGTRIEMLCAALTSCEGAEAALHHLGICHDGIARSAAAAWRALFTGGLGEPPEPGWTTWHPIGSALNTGFEIALRSTNRGFVAGLGHNGPAARFIAALVPLVTGEHPSAGSVATQLKLRRRRQQ
jgi:hypothetical protein